MAATDARGMARWALEEIAWLALLAALFVTIITAADFAAGSRSPSGASPSPAAMGTGLVAFHALLLGYVAFRDRDRLAAWLRPARGAVLLGIGAGGLLLALGAVFTFALEVAGIELPDLASEIRSIVPSSALRVAWGAVLVPIAEELYFRGRLAEGVERYVGRTAALISTALVFAIVHGVPVAIPIYAAFGAILFVLRRRTQGLVAPIIAHAVNNLVGLLTASP